MAISAQIVQSKNALDLPSKHITLLCFLQNQNQLINAIDFKLDTLNQRAKSIGDVIDKGVRDPVRSHGNVVFKVLDSAADVLGVRSTSEVELWWQYEPWVKEMNASEDLQIVYPLGIQ